MQRVSPRLLLQGELCKRALEAEESESRSSLKTWNVEMERRVALVVNEVLEELEASSLDREARAALVFNLDKFVRNSLPGASVVPFGSYTMNVFSSYSDLDLSLETNCGKLLTHDEKVWYLERLVVSLYNKQGYFTNIQPVYRATVPIVKFVDYNSGIQCDVSVDNSDGLLKSSVLGALNMIDSRVRPLCFLLKKWAKAHGINDPSNGSLSSYTLALLAVFHLQTCSPPILPPLSSLMGGLDLQNTGYCVSFVRTRAKVFLGFGSRNIESVTELFRTFFVKMLPVKDLWKRGLCASVFQGTWIAKWTFHSACISVEDFVDQSQNAAKGIKEREFDMIYHCVENTHRQFHQTIPDLLSFKATVFGGGCVPALSQKRTSPGFPNPRQFQVTKELPMMLQFRRQ